MIQQTSLEAYEEVKPTLNHRQIQVLRLFQTCFSPDGLTNWEVARELGWTINRVTPRVYELKKKGYLVEDLKRIDAITKRKAIACRLAKTLEKW